MLPSKRVQSQAGRPWTAEGVVAVITTVVLISAALAAMPAQEGKWAPRNDETRRSLLEMEREWAEADCTRAPVAKTLLADDFEGTTPEGRRFDKARAIADASSASLARDCRLGDVDVRLFGDSIAITYGTSSSIVEGSGGVAHKQCLVWTDTWLKRRGTWQVVAAQDTSVDCKSQ
jgi:uncharacterized protein DUF4440